MVTTFYPPYSFGGDAVFVRNLVRELACRGHQVEVVHNVDAYRALTKSEPERPVRGVDGVRVHGLRSSASFLSTLSIQQTGAPGMLAGQLRQILERNFDVIHFHNASLMGAPEVFSYGDAVKLYTMHEYWLVCPTHVLFKFGRELCREPECFRCMLSHRRPPQLWRYTGKLNAYARSIDRYLALNQFAVDAHRSRGFDAPMDILPPFLPNCVPVEAPEPAPARYFLFVGRLERIKGLHRLIPHFAGSGRTELWVAGDGVERTALMQQAAGNPRIKFLGHVEEPELSRLYRQAIAVVVPSLTYEVFPLVLLESFRQATPVIVPRVGGMSETVDSSGGGITYEDEAGLKHAMDTLANTQDLREQMGGRGRAAFEDRWTPEAHLTRYFRIIKKIQREKQIQRGRAADKVLSSI